MAKKATAEKKPSGAHWRKKRKESTAGASSRERAPAKLREVEPAPADPLLALPWCNQLLLACLEELRTKAGIPVLERIRAIRETAKSLGMVFPRAELEKMINDILDKRTQAKDKSGG